MSCNQHEEGIFGYAEQQQEIPVYSFTTLGRTISSRN